MPNDTTNPDQMQAPQEKPAEDQLIEFLQELDARVTALEQKEAGDTEED